MERPNLFVGLLASVLLFSAGLGDVVEYNGFQDISGLTLNGDARVVTTADGAVLRLTRPEQFQAGSVFSNQQVPTSGFTTYFRFRITEPGGEVFDTNTLPGADGLVFVIQPVSSSVGHHGGGIGYMDITPSIGVEFDTWADVVQHPLGDPSQSHVGILLNGVSSHEEGAPYTADVFSPELGDGDLWHVWIEYAGTTLEVRLSRTPQRPDLPLLARDLDIPAILGQQMAFVGFTSATGGDWENHDITYWTFNPYLPPETVPVLSISGAKPVFGANGTVRLDFTVQTSEPALKEAFVQYQTVDGTARAGQDYTAIGGTFTLPVGATCGTISVASSTTAAGKTLSVVLSNPTNATLGTALATGTIPFPPPDPIGELTNDSTYGNGSRGGGCGTGVGPANLIGFYLLCWAGLAGLRLGRSGRRG